MEIDIINTIQTMNTHLPYGLALLDECATGDPDYQCLVLTVASMIKYLLSIAGAIAIFYILSGAFDYVGGWKIEIKQGGKNKINYAVGGLILVTLSWLIVNTLVNYILHF